MFQICSRICVLDICSTDSWLYLISTFKNFRFREILKLIVYQTFPNFTFRLKQFKNLCTLSRNIQCRSHVCHFSSFDYYSVIDSSSGLMRFPPWPTIQFFKWVTPQTPARSPGERETKASHIKYGKPDDVNENEHVTFFPRCPSISDSAD